MRTCALHSSHSVHTMSTLCPHFGRRYFCNVAKISLISMIPPALRFNCKQFAEELVARTRVAPTVSRVTSESLHSRERLWPVPCWNSHPTYHDVPCCCRMRDSTAEMLSMIAEFLNHSSRSTLPAGPPGWSDGGGNASQRRVSFRSLFVAKTRWMDIHTTDVMP